MKMAWFTAFLELLGVAGTVIAAYWAWGMSPAVFLGSVWLLVIALVIEWERRGDSRGNG